MTLSRKAFFQQGLFSLGDTLLKASGVFQQPLDMSSPVPANGPGPEQPRLAQACNERCLARNCGCFSCVERCELQAITVVAGEGIRIDQQLCSGCGSCEYVCPVTPKAICFIVKQAEHYPTEGERAC